MTPAQHGSTEPRPTAQPGARGARRGRVSPRGVVTVTGEVFGLVLQVLLIWIGYSIVWDDHDTFPYNLLLWCFIAFVYLAGSALGLNILIRVTHADPPGMRVFVGNPFTRALSTVITFGASLIGVIVATDLIASFGTEDHDILVEFSAISTMLLSWALFNWGFSRIYYSKYFRAPEPPLVFPGTDHPRLTDFVYFAFTNATAFAVSDVQVVTPRMRWTVVWHTTLAFFFNALIIVLTMNTISSGRLFQAIGE